MSQKGFFEIEFTDGLLVTNLRASSSLNSFLCLLDSPFVLFLFFVLQKNRDSNEKVKDDLAKEDAKKLYEVSFFAYYWNKEIL